MGQGASTQRGREDTTHRNNSSRRLSLLFPQTSGTDDGTRTAGEEGMRESGSTSTRNNTTGTSYQPRNQNAYGTFRRRVSAQLQSTQPGTGTDEEIVYEQEERPLVNMEELGMRDAPITHITATPLLRRQSTMSRLGSRILPDSVARSLLNSGEETPAEGEAHRTGLLTDYEPTRSAHHRFPTFSSLSSRRSSASPSPRRRSIRGPYPLRRGGGGSGSELLPDVSVGDHPLTRFDNPSEIGLRSSWRRRSRLTRVRNSLTLPLSQVFSHHSNPAQSQAPPPRPSRAATFQDDSDHLLPPLSSIDHRMDLDTPLHELDANDTETRNDFSSSSTHSNRTLQAVGGGIRRLPRARSTRMTRRDDQAPLSRILQLAATTIAAQLTGQATPPMPNIQAIGAEGLDGTLQSFVQSLQDATSARASATAETDASGTTRNGSLPPVNFLRVFRFVNNEGDGNASGDGANGDSQTGNQEDRMDIDDPQGGAPDGRTVTLVVVGVRSVPSGSTSGGPPADSDQQSLDSLLNLPIVPSTNPLSNLGVRRRADLGSRFAHRRNSVGGLSSFPSNYDSQRHHRTRASTTATYTPDLNPVASLPHSTSGSPSGPHPPPSTPAEPSLSGHGSGTNTPSRRPSSASAIPHFLPHLEEHPSPDNEMDTPAVNDSFSHARQRRRSDSEFARHRELGSGAARRNGVVEPDDASGDQGRSWLIYVVGTNLSAHHPALATPSLFTENPTYEDLLMLSTLMGPAKPPTASTEAMSAAGGIYTLVEYAGALVGEAEGVESRPVSSGERCHICLCDYEVAETVRVLTSCDHLFHRDCIDTWLTTGRNNCPMCRARGVDDNSSSTPASESASGSDSSIPAASDLGLAASSPPTSDPATV